MLTRIEGIAHIAIIRNILTVDECTVAIVRFNNLHLRLVGLLLGLSEGSTSLDRFNNVLDIATIVIGIWLIILITIRARSYISSVVGNRVLGLGRRLLVNNRSSIVGVWARSLELSRICLLLWLDMLGLLV